MSRRGQVLRLKRRHLQSRLDKYKPQMVQFWGLLGDHSGNVVMGSGETHEVYVRREGRSVISNVLNLRCGNIYDMPVLVGRSEEIPHRLQVLSIDADRLAFDLGNLGLLNDHHQQHEFRNDGTGGNDPVWSSIQQLVELLVYPTSPAGWTVNVNSGHYPYADGWGWWETTTSADLSSYEPGDADTARWVLISIDTTSDPHALEYTEGDIFPTVLFPPSASDGIPLPADPTGRVPLAAIYIENGTTSITWSNIYKVTMGYAVGFTGTTTASSHELLDGSVHSDTVGVDPTRGDIVVADATPEWNVLAAAAAGAILNMDAAGEDPEWLALGARGGILKVNAGADSLEYLVVGADGEVLKSDGNDPGWEKQDADDVSYAPAVLADWDGDADPGDTDDALDQLAERVDDNEIDIAALPNAPVEMIFSQVVDVEVVNTTTETTILGAGRGSKTIAADTLDVGTTIRITLSGHLSDSGAPDLTVDVDLGGTQIASTGAQTLNNAISDTDWHLTFLITCRDTGAAGNVVGSGLFEHDDDAQFGLVNTAEVAVDTTSDLTVDVTVTWDTAHADNSIVCQEATIELMKADSLAVAAPSGLAVAEV